MGKAHGTTMRHNDLRPAVDNSLNCAIVKMGMVVILRDIRHTAEFYLRQGNPAYSSATKAISPSSLRTRRDKSVIKAKMRISHLLTWFATLMLP